MSYHLHLKGTAGLYYTGKAVWYDGTYLYVAVEGGGSYTAIKFSFNGTTFTNIASLANIGVSAQCIMGDGTYIYIGLQNTLYALNKTTMAFSPGNINPGGAINSIYCDPAGYIHVGLSTGVISAYTYNGAAFTFRGTHLLASEPITRLIGDGTRIYAACNYVNGNYIQPVTFDGTNYSLLTNQTISGVTAILYDGTHIFSGCTAATNPDILSHTFNGSWTAIQTANLLAGNGTCLDTDGHYLYLAEAGSRVGVYLHSPSTGFSLVASYVDASIPASVYHSLSCGGGYIFYLSGTNIKAVSLDLVATFNVDILKGSVTQARTFTAI